MCCGPKPLLCSSRAPIWDCSTAALCTQPAGIVCPKSSPVEWGLQSSTDMWGWRLLHIGLSVARCCGMWGQPAQPTCASDGAVSGRLQQQKAVFQLGFLFFFPFLKAVSSLKAVFCTSTSEESGEIWAVCAAGWRAAAAAVRVGCRWGGCMGTDPEQSCSRCCRYCIGTTSSATPGTLV